ncbi:MAG TPA: ATP-binding cassette domain-containing protein [Edaphobacter sp.]|jgi:osmoprotectant transport system ATP-binding protein|nr:ATP-binding cassette domain-containing protein [Edaphobacter sp.]
MPTVGVEFAKVSYTLAGGRVLLRDISLQLETGTTTALLGRSGSGKTTLLRMINGLVTPTSGEVRVGGKATRDYDLVALRRSIGYVIQETGLFPHMTVERNAGMALELAGYSAGEKNVRVGQVLELAGLDFEEYRRRYPWQLSGGQRQRVGLARALATDPQVLLMDEPFGALDPLTRAEMQTMLLGLLERVKKTVVLVTHDLEEALYLASRVIFVSDGAIVGDMTPEEVSKSENHYVKNYVRAVHHWEPK